MVLKKESTLFSRDEKGVLIPQEVKLIVDENDKEQLPFKGETVIIIPMIKAELKKAFNEAGTKDADGNDIDVDGKIILKYCINPKYEEKDLQDLKGIGTAIVNTILFESGVDVSKNKNLKKAIEKKEDDFGKN